MAFLGLFMLTGMASIGKRKKSKYWTACFTSRDGCQREHSAKTTGKNQAT